MAKTKISEYSTTASNNTDIDGISIAEGMAPSNVNNAIRELMSQLKEWQSGSVSQDMSVNGAFTATGNAVLSADLSVGDDLTVTGDASVGGVLTCTGAAVLSSNLSVAGAATIGGILSATGGTSLGAVTFSGAAVMSSTLSVTGNATVGSSTTNSHTLNGNLTVGTSTSNTVTLNTLLSAGGGTGTSGQYLQSRGTSNTPVWSSVSSITQATSKATTSGTSVNILFSDTIADASTVKKITIMLKGVSLSGTAVPLIQLGTSSGFVSTGYTATGCNEGGTATDSTAGFPLRGSSSATAAFNGNIVIASFGSNSWVESGLVRTANGNLGLSAGEVTLASTLDRVRITTSAGTETFDAGSINILYE
jgi:hypothetical protein